MEIFIFYHVDFIYHDISSQNLFFFFQISSFPVLTLLIDWNVIFRLLAFTRQFFKITISYVATPKCSAKCGKRATRNIEYRKHSSATSAETQGLTGFSHLKWNLIPTISTLPTHDLLVPLISCVVQRRVLAKCFMQFYGKPGIYLSMRNQPPHFSPLREPTNPLELLQAFLLNEKFKRRLQ